MLFRVFFGILSLAILVLCSANYWVEYTPKWKDWQKQYYGLLAAKMDDPNQAADVLSTPPQFTQIYNEELQVVDRCVICHLGSENALMDGAPNPHKLHPGNLLDSHPPQQVGCTICHQGQGRATTLDDAHGRVPHWEQPLLTGDFVQATCTKCHREDEVPDAPMLTRGKRLLHDLGCVGCHRTGETVAVVEKVGPRLKRIGSKVSRPWLNRWLMNPRGYLPKGKMPQFRLHPQAADALAAYLMTFKDKTIDALADQEGDYDAGALVYRKSQCTVCHVTREDFAGNPLGGDIGPDLRKVANKVNKRWLRTFFKNPHAFYPHTRMPHFNFSDEDILNLAQFITEDWRDFDLFDADEAVPEPPHDSPELIEQGRLLFDEFHCSACHDLTGEVSKPAGPDLTFVGSKRVHDLDFGNVAVRHTLPDFFYTKLRAPRSLTSGFQLPLAETDPAKTLWKNMQPSALFSKSAALPKGSVSQRLAWILQRAQMLSARPPEKQNQDADAQDADDREADDREPADTDDEQQSRKVVVQVRPLLDPDLKLPSGTAAEQAAWLVDVLNEVGLLNSLKMPDFQLSTQDAESLTIALMSLSEERISSSRYEVAKKRKVLFNPRDEFGQLERRYRCLSCHGIRGSGDILASDLTFEGSRANPEWLYHFLKRPYSMRRTLKIAMPLFDFPDEEARFMTEYISRVFVDSQIGAAWEDDRDTAKADRGKAIFDAKGCIACHQRNGEGGDIGPNLTTQVPEFPVGTWVGDKLRAEWIFQWLKDPQSLVPDALEPNLGLSDQEVADLTAYLMSLKNPEFQSKKPLDADRR